MRIAVMPSATVELKCIPPVIYWQCEVGLYFQVFISNNNRVTYTYASQNMNVFDTRVASWIVLQRSTRVK